MQEFPHVHKVEVSAQSIGSVDTRSPGKVSIAVDVPLEFGGPGDQWSSEGLLVTQFTGAHTNATRTVASEELREEGMRRLR
jgi:hypothetical protein